MFKKSFVKVSHKGAVQKILREHYLRNDLPCGLHGCTICPAGGALTSELAPDETILVPDTNICLHHLDVLETFINVLLLQTVLDELKNRSLALYNRLRTLVNQPARRFVVFSNEYHQNASLSTDKSLGDSSDNDRNDRAIRHATLWFSNHQPNLAVILLTNDQDCRQKASDLGLNAKTLKEYVSSLPETHPKKSLLLDMLETSDNYPSLGDHKSYPDYLSMVDLQAGLRDGRFYQGTFQASPYMRYQGNVVTRLPGDLYTIGVKGKLQCNRAIHGDVVVVKKIKKTGKETKDEEAVDEGPEGDIVAMENVAENVVSDLPGVEGEIVGILKRSMEPICGTIDGSSMDVTAGVQNVLVIPMDRRFPRLRMRTRQGENLLGQRIVVSIDSWDLKSVYPSAHLIKVLGMAGDRITESEAILLQHNVNHEPFVTQVMACLPPGDWKPTSEDYAERADFRSLCIVSVDPPGCTDIDDALHAIALPNGNFQVGVHIADVTRFVQEGTFLDQEASSRATTVYLVDRRIDMLPSLLGTNLCSLMSNIERLAFSVVWEVDPEAHIVSTHFTKSIIKSKASLTYDQAQQLLDTQDSSEIGKSLHILNTLAKILKHRRIDAGALTLASPEVRFTLDETTSNPTDVILKEMKEANSLVEEFMLLANVSVAERIYKSFPETAILRRHPIPAPENFESLNEALKPFRLELHYDTSRELADSLDRATVPDDPFFNTLVRIMTTRCMYQAQYFVSGLQTYDNFWHYGLATPIYTHFTSPIRRYADVLVHRQLFQTIQINNDNKEPKDVMEQKKSREQLQEICDNLNYRNRQAQQAQRSSVELFTHLFFKGKATVTNQPAYIVKLVKTGLVVFLPDYGIEGIINVKSKDIDAYFLPDQNVFVIGKQEYRLFQKISVCLEMIEDVHTKRPKFEISLS